MRSADPEQERHHRLDGLVRVEPLDGRLTDDQAEAARDRGSEQESGQERDAVRARPIAADDDERRRQNEWARRGDDRVEHDVKDSGHGDRSSGFTTP